MAAANSLRLIAMRSVSPGTALAPAGGTMNIQIRLPGVLLLACLGVAASLSPAAAQTIASGSNQTFGVGQPSTTMSTITVKDAGTPTIKAAKDIRIRIPSTFNMTWNTALTTATITGSGAGKVATTVTYEDAGHTLVIDATSNFAGNDQIVVSGLEFASFTAVSAGTKLQLVVDGAGAATKASDSKTIAVVAATISAGANLSFVVGQAPTAMSEITVTDNASPLITAANDIRIRIPSGFNMTWNTALTTATISGSDAAKVSTAVTYEDGGKTLVLNVTTDFTGGDQIKVSGLQYTSFAAPSATDNLELAIFGPGSGTTDFAGNDQIVVSGLGFTSFTAPSEPNYLQLVVSGSGGGTAASDSRTIQVATPPTVASAANQRFVVGQGPTAIAAITVTDAATPSITAANDLRIRIPATFNMSWNTALTAATITGSGASKVSPTVSYEDGGKTLVLNVTTDFAGGDQVTVSVLQYTSFAAPSAADNLELVVSGSGGGTAASDGRTIQVVQPTIVSAANQLFVVGQAATAMSAITVTDAATPSITAAQDIRIRIPATLNMIWNTARSTASLSGGAASKVSPTVSYEDGGKTLVLNVTTNFAGNDQIVVSGLQYTSFAAASAPDYLQLVVSGPAGGTTDGDAKTIQIVAPTIASAANQVFAVGQPATAIAAITITDAATPTITKANGIRVRIPATFNMTWNTALKTATIGGGAKAKVSTTVSYEDGGKTLVITATADFAANDQITVSGLQYTSFTAASAPDYLQLVVSGSGGGTAASDSRTIQIAAPTIASAANQVFVVGQAPAGVSPITVTD